MLLKYETTNNVTFQEIKMGALISEGLNIEVYNLI